MARWIALQIGQHDVYQIVCAAVHRWKPDKIDQRRGPVTTITVALAQQKLPNARPVPIPHQDARTHDQAGVSPSKMFSAVGT
jgi:hypothetical protein